MSNFTLSSPVFQGIIKFENQTKKLIHVNQELKELLARQKIDINALIQDLRSLNKAGALQMSIGNQEFMLNSVADDVNITHYFNLLPQKNGGSSLTAGAPTPLPAADLTPMAEDLHRLRLLTLGEMTAGIIHDINNPLSLVNSSAELCDFFLEDSQSASSSEERKELNSKAQEQVKNIKDAALRILQISEGVRMLMHKNQIKFQNQELKNILKSSASCCISFLRNSGIEFTFKDLTTSSLVSCKESLLAQVFINLIKNSHDAIKELPAHKKFIEVQLSENATHYLLKFKDGGAGIPEDVASRVFEPFFTTKNMGEGTGVGLSLCRKIIETHQGELVLDATAKNTTFVISLPKSSRGA